MNGSSDVFNAAGFEASQLSQLIKRGHGSFSRFAKIYHRSRTETGGSTLRLEEDGEIALFPSMLPWTKPPRKSRGRRGHSSSQRWEAFHRMHWLWSLFNFLEGGSPCQSSAARAVAFRASQGVWTSCHEGLAKTMFRKVLKLISHPEGTLDRGTAKLDDLISRIRLSFYDPSVTLDEVVSGAMPVNPERISLPERGGLLNPLDHLEGEQLQQFKNMHHNIPVGELVGKSVKPCHKVEPQHWILLLEKLYNANMITFLPQRDVVHEQGLPVKGGLFCVPHKPTSDRLINDRRPLNCREKRLGWSTLPAGHMLCQLILEKGESIRCSGDDLSNYFYLIQHTPEWFPRNAFGDPVLGKDIKWANLQPREKYFPVFKVVCMGDTNGVDIAQATHESVLRAASCLEPDKTLIYGKTFPAAKTLEGLYIDDHLVFQILPSKITRDRGEWLDEKLLRSSRDKYAELGLPRSEKKAFAKEYDFKAWGTQVTSDSGRVGAPYQKLRQIEVLACALVKEGRASKKALQKLLGLFVHPFMHRRELMAVFHHTYLFIEKLPEMGVRKMPPYVKDELLAATLLLALAEVDIRAPVSVQISATDASSSMGGRASTLTSKALAKTLYRFGEKRGEHTRLDWSLHGIEPPSQMEAAPPPLVDAMQTHCWTATQSLKFGKKEHINILELEMLKQEIKSRANQNRGGCRIVNLCDSRVVVGAFAKGRSSSRNLNHRLRSCIPWLLLADIRVVNLWVPTDKNPADYPSRARSIPWPDVNVSDPLISPSEKKVFQTFRSVGVQSLLESEARRLGTDAVFSDVSALANETDGENLRDVKIIDRPNPLVSEPFSQTLPGPKADGSHVVDSLAAEAPADSQHTMSKKAFREIFSGKGRLTEQMKRVGCCKVLEPVEYMKHGKIIEEHNILNAKAFRQLKSDASLPDQTWHFGLPCGSFSILQHSNKGTRRKDNPQGNGTLLREVIGNEILRRTLKLIEILEKSGNHWTMENPASSYLWLMPEVKTKIDNPKNFLVHIDQCCYGLKLLDEDGVLGPCKKPTKFLGNISVLKNLESRCQCVGGHVHAVGGVKTKQGWKRRSELAGHYPLKLCNAYAKMLRQHYGLVGPARFT